MPETTRAIRNLVYQHLASRGRAPSSKEMAAELGLGAEEARHALRSLHAGHDLVLDESGEVAMALPFSARPTPFVVASGPIDYWANCAWDALAVPLVVRRDATIRAEWAVDGTSFEITVTGETLDAAEGVVHFAVPARRWWDDIFDT